METIRMTNLIGANTRHYYYSDQWQVLEERLNSSGSADKKFVWGMRYIDDLILRDSGGTRHYVLHDYFNVTAIINTSGAVQERYGYDAFGGVRFMNASFGSASSGYTWETLYGAYRYDHDTGLCQVRYRYLHPKLGRWEKRDPLADYGFARVANKKMENWFADENTYWYVENRATNRVDINGLSSVDEILEMIANVERRMRDYRTGSQAWLNLYRQQQALYQLLLQALKRASPGTICARAGLAGLVAAGGYAAGYLAGSQISWNDQTLHEHIGDWLYDICPSCF